MVEICTDNFKIKIKNNMNNTKQILDTVVETQNKAMNSFVETATKFQEALKSENAFRIMPSYLSTMSLGLSPSFLARRVMAAPCSSAPQIKATSWRFILKNLTKISAGK